MHKDSSLVMKRRKSNTLLVLALLRSCDINFRTRLLDHVFERLLVLQPFFSYSEKDDQRSGPSKLGPGRERKVL